VRWIIISSTMLLVTAAAVPPVFFWWVEGPRTRESEGRWETYMKHGAEISIEISDFSPTAEPTVKQVMSAAKLLDDTRREASRFADFRSAVSIEGFTVSNAEVLDNRDAQFYHVFNPANAGDEKTLDASRPESLIYHHSEHGMHLVGVMYMTARVKAPQPGGRLTRWHYHPRTEFCMDTLGIPKVKAGKSGSCPAGLANGPTPLMMHVWLADNPHGAFAHQMALEDHHGAMHGNAHAGKNPYREFGRRGVLRVKELLGN
jgi:hypothetical protein